MDSGSIPPRNGSNEAGEGLDRAALQDLVFRTAPLRRFTQDSPVLPDVWFEYGANPDLPLDLLLTPIREASTGQVFTAIRARLENDRASEHHRALAETRGSDPQLAYSNSTVVGTFWFDELVRVILPLSMWPVDRGDAIDEWLRLRDATPKARSTLVQDLVDLERGRSSGRRSGLAWMARIVGTIELARRRDPIAARVARRREEPLSDSEATRLVDAVAELLAGAPEPEKIPALIFSVSRNRAASTTMWRSVPAIKADAARRLFELSCADIHWAIVDSGIDATHMAFRMRDQKGEPNSKPFDGLVNATRVVATYDFTRIRDLLNPDRLENEAVSEELHERLNEGDIGPQEIAAGLRAGRHLDWDTLAPLLAVPHEEGRYVAPQHEHGTHVAGILAGNWRGEESGGALDHDLVGVCPDIHLYDIRVLDEEGKGDEFSVTAALQFIRHLNANKDHVVVHGVNLSLSIPHDVANYACGRTPVCEECERLVNTGVVVVAAAGNEGYMHYVTAAGLAEGYRNISITDPGNTQSVITVGATHRYRAHTYGVSYFSSRGPTGDGRIKPDLVAPGEKIWSAVPDDNVRTLDGTSMATPHVSGCVALLLARHRELVGQPGTVKELLCRTATDLGRERYFQGSGMVDILRAIQAV